MPESFKTGVKKEGWLSNTEQSTKVLEKVSYCCIVEYIRTCTLFVHQNISKVTFHCKRRLSNLNYYFHRFTLRKKVGLCMFYNTPIPMLFIFPSEHAQPIWVFPTATQWLAHVDYIMRHVSKAVAGCRCWDQVLGVLILGRVFRRWSICGYISNYKSCNEIIVSLCFRNNSMKHFEAHRLYTGKSI